MSSRPSFSALGLQSKHSLGPDSVAQLQAMRDLVTPATLAWEREGDLEAQGKEHQSWRDVALAFWQSSARDDEVSVQVEVEREEQGIGETHGKDQGEEQRVKERTTAPFG